LSVAFAKKGLIGLCPEKIADVVLPGKLLYCIRIIDHTTVFSDNNRVDFWVKLCTDTGYRIESFLPITKMLIMK
jgi:hypothetical protein